MREEITLEKKEAEAIIENLQELPMNKVEMLVNFFRSKLNEPVEDKSKVFPTSKKKD